ncbi:metallophosphoesterase family protein [Duganella hordei]|uniref:metallophosphoesterase family protein n=1 Tax=Duganella hordei TaxID=2865934 RepID=UPI0030E99645
MSTTLQRLGASAVLALVLASAGQAHAAKPDPVVMSFATVGDSREDPGTAATAQDKVYLQNTRALSRILREIQAAKPKALFFNGDMIMGYTADRTAIAREYAYWRGMVAGLMENGTYVVPVSGNHEIQFKGKDAAGKTTKTATVDNENLWRESMGDLILDTARWEAVTGIEATAYDVNNTPPVDGPDGNRTSLAQLTYSFDAGGSHFAVISTDPVGNDGHGPAHWLAEDFRQAKARGAKRFFVFGHKPAYTYLYRAGVEPDGMDIYPDNASAFWAVVEEYGAAYFSGHQHIFNAQQPTLASGGKAWQVIVGSGGSPFTAKPGASANPQDRMYAWAQVKVRASGRVHIDIYGFDDHYGKTQRLKTVEY